MSFVNAQTGWVVACSEGYCYQQDARQAFIKTDDGGLSWQTIEVQLMP